MKIIKKRYEINSLLKANKSLSFVPTMGSLHKGHLSLIRKAKIKNTKVLVSIFVNPKQFNNKKDFKLYPRNISKDLKILNKINVDYVYLPNYNDVYSFKTKNRIFLHRFSKELCGKFRPNHFRGVVDVVNRLSEIVKPKYLFLGKKDYQQLVLIKRHFYKNNSKIKVIECETYRDSHGVAESSRNKNLSKNQLLIARKVFKTIKKLKNKFKYNEINKTSVINQIKNKILSYGVEEIDYINALNLKTFKKPNKVNKKFQIFIAYYLGKIRLIDNI